MQHRMHQNQTYFEWQGVGKSVLTASRRDGVHLYVVCLILNHASIIDRDKVVFEIDG